MEPDVDDHRKRVASGCCRWCRDRVGDGCRDPDRARDNRNRLPPVCRFEDPPRSHREPNDRKEPQHLGHGPEGTRSLGTDEQWHHPEKRGAEQEDRDRQNVPKRKHGKLLSLSPPSARSAIHPPALLPTAERILRPTSWR